MAYHHDRDLNLAYSPEHGYFHFVLYVEPVASSGSAMVAINATQSYKNSTSRYAAEWQGKLTSCVPDALHVSLVATNEAQGLWYPCVYDDPESPAAIDRDGCTCLQTFRDPLTWLPVVAQHYRTVSGNIEEWTRLTYSPLSLPGGERLASIIIDQEVGMFWARTDHGTLYILPQKEGAGYGTGYSGGGPSELARLIVKIVESGGRDLSAGTTDDMSNKKVRSWVFSGAAKRTQELTLAQLELLCQTGSPT